MSTHEDPRAEYKRKWYQDNKERVKQARKEHYQRNKVEVLKRQAEYRKQNAEAIRLRQSTPEALERKRLLARARAYSLTLDEVIELAKVAHCQSCGCELSEETSDAARHFDHCHETGAFRGILCSRCNRALGLLDDDPVKLQALINYLKKHDTEQ